MQTTSEREADRQRMQQSIVSMSQQASSREAELEQIVRELRSQLEKANVRSCHCLLPTRIITSVGLRLRWQSL